MIKKILIISSFFENHIGYQEVQFAETLSSMDFEVKVIATDRSNFDLEKRYEDSSDRFEIKRIKKLIRIKNTFYTNENLEKYISDFKPDLVFLILPGSGIPYFLLRYISKEIKVISVFSDTTIENRIHKTKGTKGNKIIFNLLKKNWYNKVFERSDLLIANTNETATILKTISKKNIENKIRIYGLGFDPEKYFYSEELRNDYRKELGLKEKQKLFVTISRIYPGKPFEFWVSQIKDFLNMNEDYFYLLGGFEDTKYSQKVEASLKGMGLGEKLILHKFASAEEANKIFNAADFSLWFMPTISIQQSMATGLFAFVPFDSTLDHLIERNVNGTYYNDYNDLRKELSSIQDLSYNREENLKINKKFSYLNIMQKAISEVS